jgi:hypothetical protein
MKPRASQVSVKIVESTSVPGGLSVRVPGGDLKLALAEAGFRVGQWAVIVPMGEMKALKRDAALEEKKPS